MTKYNMIFALLFVLIGCGGTVEKSNGSAKTVPCSWAQSKVFSDFSSNYDLKYLGGVWSNGNNVWLTATSDVAHLFHRDARGWHEVPIGNFRSAYLIKADAQGNKYLMVQDNMNRYGILQESGGEWTLLPGPEGAQQLSDFALHGEDILVAGLDADDKPQVWKRLGAGWKALILSLDPSFRVAKLALRGDQLLVAGNVWNPDVGYDGCFMLSGPTWQNQKLPKNCKMVFDITPQSGDDLAYVSAVTKENQGMIINVTGDINFPAHMSNDERNQSFVRMLDDGNIFWLASIAPQGVKEDVSEPNLTLVAETLTHPRSDGSSFVITEAGGIPLDLWVADDGGRAYLTTMGTLYTCE